MYIANDAAMVLLVVISGLVVTIELDRCITKLWKVLKTRFHNEAEAVEK